MKKAITKENLKKFLSNLKNNNYSLIAPKKVEKDVVFDIIDNVNEIEFNFTNTVKPPKEFFLPQLEPILEFDKDKIKLIDKKEKRVLFGIRPCDLQAIYTMDFTFKDSIEDPIYLNKRKNTIIIALGCIEICDENAFCDSAKAGPIAKDNFDLQLIKFNGGNDYYVESGSKIGNNLINKNKELFDNLNKEENKELKKIISRKLESKKVNLDKFFRKLDNGRFKDIKYWEKVSKTCLRCGACNYLCPSCFCFNMVDNNKERSREWDSCMFRGFTREANNVIPREKLYTRFRQRIFHKYKWHRQRYNVDMCTGCGRCITYCPALIDYIKIINEVNEG